MFCPVGYNQMCDGICPDHGACRGKPETERDMGNTHEENWAERRLDLQARENHYMVLVENERLSAELERAKLLFNDLSRENEALRNSGQMTPEVLKRYCDNARAYGFEVGKKAVVTGFVTVEAVYQSSPDNPFTDPNWDKFLRDGFFVTAKDNQL